MATIYKYNDYEYRDEDGEFTLEDVKQQLAQYFPELARATTEKSTDGEGNTVITFVKRAGTKGESALLRVGDGHWINVSHVAEVTQDGQCLYVDRVRLCGTEAAAFMAWLEQRAV